MTKITRKSGYELNTKTGFGRAYIIFSLLVLAANLIYTFGSFLAPEIKTILLVSDMFISFTFLIGLLAAETVRYSLIQKFKRIYSYN